MDFESQIRNLNQSKTELVEKKLESLENSLYSLSGNGRDGKNKREDVTADLRIPRNRDGLMHTASQPANVSEWKDSFPYLRVEGVSISDSNK